MMKRFARGRKGDNRVRLSLAALAVAAVMAAIFCSVGSGGAPHALAQSDGPTGEPVRGNKKPPAGAAPEASGQQRPSNGAGSPTSGSPTLGTKTGVGPRAKFDPVAVNGKYFEGWPKPKLALVITGRQDGYLEPCGCSGLENQKGGFSRRATLFKELSAQGWPLAAVDVGSFVRRFGKQAELQFGICADALKLMHYSAAGFGPSDLRLSAGEIAAVVAGSQPDQGIFVSANVDVFGLLPRVRITTAGGLKLGITSVLGDEYRKQVNNTELETKPAADSLQEIMPQLKGCDLRILLANATLEESQALAKQFPQFDVVVTAGGPDEPPNRLARVEGTKTCLVEVGHKGMFAVVLGYYDDLKQPRYQSVALDSRYGDSLEMKVLMTNYQSQLQSLGWSGLGLRPVGHPRAQNDNPLSGKFLGAESCRECHQAAWDVYSHSKHAMATETLAKLKPARIHDPECVSCHVTGWNPQEFFPFATGFESLEKTPKLVGNSCENCHGPGAAARGGRKRQEPTLARPLAHGHAPGQGDGQGRRLREVPRPGQQHRLQLREVLGRDRALVAEPTQAPICRVASPRLAGM